MLKLHVNKRAWPKVALRRLRIFRRFRRDRSGATAVEFAFIALPFFALLFAIIQTAIVFFAQQILETAVADSARLILTGQVQGQQLSQQDFKSAVCARLPAMFDCANKVHVDVRSYGGFGSVNVSAPIDAQGKFVEDFAFSPGGAEEIVVVRVMHEWTFKVPLLGFSLANLANGNRLMVASAAFRNEPF
jgi:Flp pilus assembly protein TadG